MIGKTFKIIISFTIALTVIIFGSYFFQNYTIKKSLDEFNGEKLDTRSYALIRCNFDFFEPEFAYVYFGDNEGDISFDKINKVFWSAEDWKTSSTGGTIIRNTTFSQLVKMAKEDCSQFQEDYDNPKVDEGGIDWGYHKADPPKPQEEIDDDRKWKVIRINDAVNSFSEKVQSMIKERYGSTTSMSYDEIIEFERKVNVDDEIQRYISPFKDDEYVYTTDEDYIPVMDYIKYRFGTYYGNQPEEFIKFYGDPTKMTDTQLLKLAKDYIKNKGFDKSLEEYFIYL